MIDSYPLSWPAAWQRTKANDRARPRFHRTEQKAYSHNPSSFYRDKKELGIYDASWRILDELKKMGVDVNDGVIISSNVESRSDGIPRSDRRAPTDPGVAVYWKNPETRQQQCMAIDLYETVAGNLAAVAATLGAMRAIERHGGAQILKRAFEGFKALPSSTTPALSTEQAARAIAWRENGSSDDAKITAAADMIVNDRDWARNAIRRAVLKTHPDVGGKQADFQLVQEAKRVLEAHHGGQL
jgi:hypothetical protein